MALLVLAPVAASGQLWDILLEGGLESTVLQPGQTPIVSGRLVDHAGDPVAGAIVSVRLGSASAVSTTGQDGSFRAVLEGFDGLPGTHVASMMFSDGQKKGAASERLQVSGTILRSVELARQLETPTAQRYLASAESDYADDPLGLVMHRHYVSLAAEYRSALEKEGTVSEVEALVAERREAARLAELRDVEEKSPGAGSFSGWRYDRFVANLDDSVRDIITEQLGHSSFSLEHARSAMTAVLEAGGTRAEARAAYLGQLGLSQAQMEMISAGLVPDTQVQGLDTPLITDSATAVPTPAVHVDPETGRVTVSAGGVETEFVIKDGKLSRSD